MKPDPIQQLLQETDQRRPADSTSNASDLAGRVLKIRNWRRNVRIVSTLALLLISGTLSLIVLRERGSATQQLAMDGKASLQGPVTLDQELRDLQSQIAVNEQIIRRLKAMETIERAEAEIARLQSRQFPEQEITERAASAVVYQTDRMYRSTGQSASALQAYREVIEHFPGTASAELAKQRVINIERAG